MKCYMDKNTVCPFYSQQDNLKIHCEGFSADNRIQLSFASRQLMRKHKDKHCNNIDGYTHCPLYSIIIKQYKDGDQ